MKIFTAESNIYTDPLGRIKVQFPWDRYGPKNQNSSSLGHKNLLNSFYGPAIVMTPKVMSRHAADGSNGVKACFSATQHDRSTWPRA